MPVSASKGHSRKCPKLVFITVKRTRKVPHTLPVPAAVLTMADAEFIQVVVFEHTCEVEDCPGGLEPISRHKYTENED